MSTSERLAAMVELAASNNEEDEKEDEQRKNLDCINSSWNFFTKLVIKCDYLSATNSDSGDLMDTDLSSLIGMDAAQASLLARFNLNGADLLQASSLLQKSSLGQSSLNGHLSNRMLQDAAKTVR